MSTYTGICAYICRCRSRCRYVDIDADVYPDVDVHMCIYINEYMQM